MTPISSNLRCFLQTLALINAGATLHSCTQPPSYEGVPAEQPVDQGPVAAGSGATKSKAPLMVEKNAWRQAEDELGSNLKEIGSSNFYSPQERAYAAQLRKWPQCSVEGTQLRADLTTSWKNLDIDYRVTLSGSKAEISEFLQSKRHVRVRFMLSSGITNFNFPLLREDFKAAGPEKPGTVRMTAAGSVQCPLRRYTRATGWYLTWAG